MQFYFCEFRENEFFNTHERLQQQPKIPTIRLDTATRPLELFRFIGFVI
jgi:hypothetical protein